MYSQSPWTFNKANKAHEQSHCCFPLPSRESDFCRVQQRRFWKFQPFKLFLISFSLIFTLVISSSYSQPNDVRRFYLLFTTKWFRPFWSISASGRYDPIRQKRPDTAETGRIGPVWRESMQIEAKSMRIRAESAQVGESTWQDTARRGTNAWSAASLPRPAASDVGAMALEPRLCIPD